MNRVPAPLANQSHTLDKARTSVSSESRPQAQEASLPSPGSCCWGQKHSRVPRVSVAQGKAPYSGSDARGSGPDDLQLAQAGVLGQPSVLVLSTGLTTPARLP